MHQHAQAVPRLSIYTTTALEFSQSVDIQYVRSVLLIKPKPEATRKYSYVVNAKVKLS